MAKSDRRKAFEASLETEEKKEEPKPQPPQDLTIIMRAFEDTVIPHLRSLATSVLILYLMQLQMYEGRARALHDGDTLRCVTDVMKKIMGEIDRRFPVAGAGAQQQSSLIVFGG